MIRKSIVSLLLVFIMVISFILPVGAQDLKNVDNEYQEISNTISKILEFIKNEPDLYGLNNVNFSSLYLGDKIPVYNVEQEKMTVNYYPIFQDNIVVALAVTNVDENGEKIVQISKYFTKEINTLLKSNDSIALINNGVKLFAITDNRVLMLEDNSDLVTSQMRKSAANITDVKDFALLDKTFLSPVSKLNISNIDNIQPMATYPKQFYLSIPFKLQGDYPICWAACVASIGQYKTGINKTAKDVAYETVGGYIGVPIATVGSALGNIYGLNTTVLNSNIPFYIIYQTLIQFSVVLKALSLHMVWLLEVTIITSLHLEIWAYFHT